MSSSFVWVQLYYKGKDKPEGQPIKIKPIPEDVADLAEAAIAKLPNSLSHCDAADLFVYPPDTKPPFSQDKALKSWDPIPSNSSGPQPLIVVAPAQKQQQERQVVCRTWGESKYPLRYLPANSYDDLKQQASQQFEFDADKVTLYYIPNRNDLTSRKKIQGDTDLEEFIQIANTPAVLAWERGSNGSPKEFPGVIATPFSGSNVSSISISSRGHVQKVFQTAVLARDGGECIVSKMRYKQGSGNVQAAHIIPVAKKNDSSLDDARNASGLWSLYDTCNGISLEASLHTAFDSYLWCMDETGKFYLSDAEKDAAKINEYKLDTLNGKTLKLNIDGGSGYPTAQLLKARYELFRFKVDEKKKKEGGKSRGRRNNNTYESTDRV